MASSAPSSIEPIQIVVFKFSKGYSMKVLSVIEPIQIVVFKSTLKDYVDNFDK